MGLRCLSVKTLKIHERMELSCSNTIHTNEFSVEIPLENCVAIENTYFV